MCESINRDLCHSGEGILRKQPLQSVLSLMFFLTFCNLFQSVLLIDSESQTTSTIKNECDDEQSPCRGYILGTIADSFICSHNLPEALDGKREEQQREKRKFHEIKNEQDEKEDLEMKDLLLELSSIEKKEESWSKWTLEYSDSLKYDDS